MSNYPENDEEFTEYTITKVTPSTEGTEWAVCSGSICVWVQPYAGTPHVGSVMRLYGKAGLGHHIRGIFIDEVKVRFSTPEEYSAESTADRYGATCEEWLAKWDNDELCWTVEMGGMGPAYEQAIQIVMAELLRWLVSNGKGVDWGNKEEVAAFFDRLDKASRDIPVIKSVGPSGAQFQGALNIALMLYSHGPSAALSDKAIEDRLIMVTRLFPNPYED